MLWLKSSMEQLSYSFNDYKPLTWASYHAHLQPPVTDPPSISAMLPLFPDKADSPAMIKHAMDILKDVTSFLHPGQMPVMACDCPIFAKAKFIQWTWPATYGESEFLVMFGGLHLEMGMWNMLGDYLASSGWTTALCYEMITRSPTFQYWNTILSLEELVLVFVRAHHEKKFSLYVEALKSIVGYFFAFDHYNYARWVSVHISDMSSFSTSFRQEFQNNWVVSKMQHKFSSIPIDQAHEQHNAVVKGKGGIIGLTENPAALQRWLICGPELARSISEFESEIEHASYSSSQLHHEEGLTAQTNFKQQVNSLVDVISTFGHPFEDDCPELVVLNTRACANDSVAVTVKRVKDLGREQYLKYKNEVLINRTGSIHDTIKRNSLALFRSPEPKLKSKTSQQLAAYRSNTSLFGLTEFFLMKTNQPPLRYLILEQ